MSAPCESEAGHKFFLEAGHKFFLEAGHKFFLISQSSWFILRSAQWPGLSARVTLTRSFADSSLPDAQKLLPSFLRRGAISSSHVEVGHTLAQLHFDAPLSVSRDRLDAWRP